MGEQVLRAKDELGRSRTSSRDEMNLAEFPLTVLSTRSNPDTKTLEFKDSIRLRSGELIEREWIITGADKFGLPTATDDDVILGLMCLTMDQGFRDRKVYFSRYELLKILRWSSEGRSYQRLTRSLDRLSGVRIRAQNAFFDNSTKGFQTCNFGVIDAYELNDSRGSKCLGEGGEGKKSFFIWSEAIFDSFKCGFIKKIDLDFYFTLNSAVSRRLYRYLDKHFYFRPVIEKPLLTLAFEKLGLSRSYQYVSAVKQQLEPACEELCKRGFLESYEFLGKGATTLVRFVSRNGRSESEPRIKSDPEVPTRTPSDQEGLRDALVERGLSRSQIEKLLNGKGADEIARLRGVLKEYDTFLRSGSSGSVRNPAALLYRAIEDPSRYSFGMKPKERTRRPELKLVGREGEEAPVPGISEESVDEAKRTLGAEVVEKIYADVNRKLASLRTVLDEARFSEAVEGCVREELVRRI